MKKILLLALALLSILYLNAQSPIVSTENAVTTILYPEGATTSNSGIITGAIKITLPVGYTNTMIKLKVEIYNHLENASSHLNLSGYTNATVQDWRKCTATLLTSSSNQVHNVYFGDESGKTVIWVGESNTKWTHPKVRVTEIQLGYINYASNLWETGWDISFDNADFSQKITETVTSVLPIANTNSIWKANGNNINYGEGRVGIGTESPTRQLEVGQTGEIALGTTVTTNSNAGIFWYQNDNNYSITRTEGNWSAPNYQQLKLDWQTGIVLDPGTGDNSGYSRSFVEITGGKGLRVSQGTVGIGIEDPGEFKLAVNGDVKAKKIKVTPDNWSDFVFDDDYDLTSLTELEAYIQVNKHLPNIPSEKQVFENGIFLGEMDAKFLQKIEELTLYVIEQKKQIDKLEEENRQLKKLEERVFRLEQQ